MEFLLAAIAVVVLVGIAYLVWRARPPSTRRPLLPPSPAEPRITVPVTTLVVDIRAGDPDSPSVQRLVRSVAVPILERSEAVEEVIVKDRDGNLVGRLERPEPAPEPHELSEPPLGLRLHPRSYQPSERGVVERPVLPEPAVPDAPDVRTPFMQRYDLPPSVRVRVRDPDDPVEVVRAIVDAAGRSATVSGPSVVTDEELLIVVSGYRGVVTGDDLTQAYLRFEASRAPRGVAICLGYVDPDELRRREILAPNLRHAGHDAIQRMADAVALGADPMAFIEGPSVSTEL